MPIKTQHLHKYGNRVLPLANLKTKGVQCPVCGHRYILRVETGTGWIYAHPNELLCHKRYAK
jgi:DNA-directed RNA polymerase subunit RPC12/RpoP